MGLFTNKNKPCILCGEPTPRLFPTTVEGQPICGNCKGKIDLPDGVFFGMSLEDVRKYMAFYDENKALRDIYKETLWVPCGGWNDRLSLDMDHKLFRIRDKGDAMVLEGSALKGFRILEDERVLYESSPAGLKHHPSDIPARVQNLVPIITQFHMQHMQYEHMQEIERRMQEQSDGKTSSSISGYMEPPRFTHQVIEHFHVELTLDHPYWGGTRSLEYTQTPRFDDTCPDAGEFMDKYNKHTKTLHTLALDLMSFINPDAREIKAGPVPQKIAIATDPVKEIQRYKSLLDSGAITEEEFTAKKKQLLDI